MSGSLRGEALYGTGWYARRNGDHAVLSMPTGMWDTGDLLYPISLPEFHRLREEPDSIRELVRRCEAGRSADGWSAERNPKCIVHVQGGRFPETLRFEIPSAAFERLQEDPGAIDEIYRAHHANHV